MKCCFLLLIACLSLATAFSQTDFTASGKVLDAATGQPLPGTSVFCQLTTIGTITNNNGEFALRLPKGGYDLIVSYTGYETQELHINNTNAANITIALKAADKSLSEVTVAGSNEVADGFAKYGRFFVDNFIGTTPHARQCLIKNPEVLHFFYSKKRNRLKVKADSALVITNNALGYNIKYQLDSFAYDYATDVSIYTGYPFFEELTGTETQQQQWLQNRISAYNGSRLHFVRSWYDSTLEEEGFRLEQIDSTRKTLTTLPLTNPYDSAHYTVGDNEEVEINRPGKLRVTYTHELPDKNFLVQYKLPVQMKSQVSILTIADAFVIEQNGYFYEQADIINTGYWSWEKVAEALPYDYQP